MRTNQVKLDKLKSLLPQRESRVEFMTSKLEENEATKQRVSAELKIQEALFEERQGTVQPVKLESKGKQSKATPLKEASPAQDDRIEVVIKELKSELLETRKMHQSDMKEWEEATAALQSTQDKIDAMEAEAVQLAKRAREKDSFAIQRLARAMAILKTIIAKLIAKIPALDDVVRARRNDEEYDPYEVGDLRRVYSNMLFKFRKDDDI